MKKHELQKHIKAYEKGQNKYSWDELEEIITISFDDGEITSDDFDELMEELMSTEAREEDDPDEFKDDSGW